MNGIYGVQPPTASNAVDPVTAAQPTKSPIRLDNVTDTVEISLVAKLAAKVDQLPEVRTELIERVKAQIAAGTYETPERIEIAAERLMEELVPDL